MFVILILLYVYINFTYAYTVNSSIGWVRVASLLLIPDKYLS